MKLSENQKLLLKRMRTGQVIYTAHSHRFIFVKTLSRIPIATARSLHNKGLFTIDNDGLCHLTELGKTIDIQ